MIVKILPGSDQKHESARKRQTETMKGGGFFFFEWVVVFAKKVVNRATRGVALAGCDHNNIYKYFRKQGAKIGEGCVISVKSLGSEPYLVSLGDHVWISKGVIFHTHDGGAWVMRDKKNPFLAVYGPIVIEDNCLIGVGVQLLPNIRIGKNSIIGAGSVVISSIPPNSIVMGVPARPISSFSKYREKCLERWEEQKPLDLDANKDGWSQSSDARDKMRRHLTEIFSDQPVKEN
jgi:acetyltransferase-like isoleucine patch superfamily enzyme